MKKWKCDACGFTADGEMAPDVCPVCGAGENVFVDASLVHNENAKQWLCLFCGYIYEADEQPAMCPECHAKGHNIFVEYDPNREQLKEAGKMYRCNSCNLVNYDEGNPDECVACGASALLSRDEWFRRKAEKGLV